jgi:hypothetical protein
MRPSHVQHESLAAFLARVRPGDACACCGAKLVAADRRAGSAGPTAASGDHTGAAVYCPACGCELSDEEIPEAAHSWRTLSPAA